MGDLELEEGQHLGEQGVAITVPAPAVSQALQRHQVPETGKHQGSPDRAQVSPVCPHMQNSRLFPSLVAEPEEPERLSPSPILTVHPVPATLALGFYPRRPGTRATIKITSALLQLHLPTSFQGGCDINKVRQDEQVAGWAAPQGTLLTGTFPAQCRNRPPSERKGLDYGT